MKSAKSVDVSVSARPRAYEARITACHLLGRQTCHRISGTAYSVTGMSPGQRADLTATIRVPKHSRRKRVTLVANAWSPQAASPASASASVAVSKATPSPSVSPTGVGVSLPGLSAGGSSSLPILPNALGNPGSAFPAVTPSPSPVHLPAARHARLANASATVPLDMRLIGGQVAGLAVLAAAVTIAVARLSLRKPQPEAPSAEKPADPT